MAADIGIGAEFEHPRRGDELFVVKRDVEGRPAGRSARNRGAPIGRVEISAVLDQGVDDGQRSVSSPRQRCGPILCPPRAAQCSAV